MENLLNILEDNARLGVDQLATMTSASPADIKAQMNQFEKDGVILGYKTIIDWDKTNREYVTALIEVKMTPARDRGFDKAADKICSYPEVQSLYLMSGAYDLMLLIEGKTMKEVAYFVAQKLAPIEGVISTATHFILRKYKDKGVIYGTETRDERGNCN